MSKHYVKIKGLATLIAELSNNKTETINTLVTDMVIFTVPQPQ